MFALIWLHWALEEFADVYVTATPEERERLAATVEALNSRLQSDPFNEGESRSGGYRITFPRMLAVIFRVDEKECVVYVVSVKRYGR